MSEGTAVIFGNFLECDIRSTLCEIIKRLMLPRYVERKKMLLASTLTLNLRAPDLCLDTAKLDADEAFDKAWVQISGESPENRI